MGGTPLSPPSLIPRRARFELEHLAAKERRGKRYEGERFARAAVIFRRSRFLHERKDEGWRGRYTINGDGENLSLFVPIQCQARSVLDDGIITFRCVIGTLEVRVSSSSLSRTPPSPPLSLFLKIRGSLSNIEEPPRECARKRPLSPITTGGGHTRRILFSTFSRL